MSLARRTPRAIDAWKQTLHQGDPLPVPVQRQLLAEIELLRSEPASQRVEFAKKAAGALEKRLGEVAAYNSGGCPTCREVEARAFLAKLKRIAEWR